MGEKLVVPAEESVTPVFPRSQPPAATWNGLGSWNVIHAASPPPRWAPLLLPSPAGWPVGQLLPRGLEEEEEEL